MQKKRNLIYGIISLITFIMFIVLMILLLTVDRHTLSNGIEIGLFSFNKLFFNTGPSYPIWDILSDVIMYSSFSFILYLVVIGIIQLIKYKSFKKVNPDILAFGIMFIVIICWWLVFDKGLVVNHRPILIDGKLESSFPSTHVLVVTFIMLEIGNYLSKRVNNKLLSAMSFIGAILIIASVTSFRVIANMHWFTDVLGGVLLGTSCSFLSFIISDRLTKIFNYSIE